MNAKATAFSIDELGFIQIAPTDVLSAVAKGELDLNHLARLEMANRGLDVGADPILTTCAD